jgi:hypothetical protein
MDWLGLVTEKANKEYGSLHNLCKYLELNEMRLNKYLTKRECQEQSSVVIDYMSNKRIKRNIIEVYDVPIITDKNKAMFITPLFSNNKILTQLSRKDVEKYIPGNDIQLIVVADKTQTNYLNTKTDIPYTSFTHVLVGGKEELDAIISYFVLSGLDIYITHEANTFFKLEILPIFDYMETKNLGYEDISNLQISDNNEETISLARRLLCNIPIDEYKNKIKVADQVELVEIYSIVKEYMKFTDLNVARLYGINLLNVIKWSRGDVTLGYVGECIKHYISYCVEGSIPTCKKVKEDTYTEIDDVVELVKQRSPSKINVIDGDNLKVVKKHVPSVMNIVVLKNGKVTWDAPNTIFLHSKTTEKDAADTCACILMGKISALFPDIKMTIITKDHFAKELSMCLGCTRKG